MSPSSHGLAEEAADAERMGYDRIGIRRLARPFDEFSPATPTSTSPERRSARRLLA